MIPELQSEVAIQEVLNYWFGDLQSPEVYPQEKSKIWFGGGEEMDREILGRFQHLVLDARNHQLDDWKQSSKGRLALIILIDQFSRHIFRGTPDAFAFDTVALGWTLEGLGLGADQELLPIERTFFYLPLEHSENLTIQELSRVKFKELRASVPPSLTPIFERFEDYAERHYLIIQEFGRFPHRNAILGRASTSEELEFLKRPHSSF